ncbi:homologous-pairing protein 2 homolog [Oncorhynchus kisutch]|uniref:homologous-pairing protein 2 homolog n=1 Tax=Oncorhynchus kisutch TaxID=8019 RepID=UPI00099F4CF9|nr:homologous-pairing protein 2 homolog [Oncorhynchus kisutch]XP_031689906.1 homologous-pairing protein 2 homolog [Oncorhynchus kisutch]
MSKKDNGGLTVIFAYLNEKNRPYSAQDVFNNLQKQHGLGKTAVVKAMEQLALEGKIKEKTYGKQKIYFADQAQFAEVSEADLKAIDSRSLHLCAEVRDISQGCRQLDTELKELNSSLTTEEIISEIQELKEVCSGYSEHLEKIKSATNHVTPEQKEMVYKERHLYVKEWKKRKRLAADMMSSILEGYPKTKKQFLEEVGVETDEDCKVTMPST